jgi:prepilin-type N-terminal cleavage/methylation domain-containing protein/prepilin-type processing-associated H-X9-DG protein
MERMRSSAKYVSRVRGFTLIELLVVVAIIAVLVSMLLPALNSAREMARQVADSSNLKQTGMAASMYHGDNNGLFPYDYIPGNAAGMSYSRSWWPQLLLTYLGNNPMAVVGSRGSAAVIKDDLAARNPPVNITEEQLAANNYYHWFSSGPHPLIGYNHLGLGCGGYAGTGFGCVHNNGGKIVKTTVDQVDYPSEMVMFQDNGYIFATPLCWGFSSGYEDTYMMIWWPNSVRYNSGLNVSFVDGHVELDKIDPYAKYTGFESQRYWFGEDGIPNPITVVR